MPHCLQQQKLKYSCLLKESQVLSELLKTIYLLQQISLFFDGNVQKDTHGSLVRPTNKTTRSGPNIPAVDLFGGGDFFGLDHFVFNELGSLNG